MSVLFILIIISGIIAGAFLIGFIWSVRTGQYDDTYSPSVRMLFNDKKPEKPGDDSGKKRKKMGDEGKDHTKG